MGFGKRNIDLGPAKPAPRQSPVSDRGFFLLFATLLIASMALLIGLNPKLRTMSWWFGPRPETPYLAATAAVVFLLVAYNNWHAARRRDGRQNCRNAGSANGDASFILPDWCADYSGGGGGGDCDGGDGGGD